MHCFWVKIYNSMGIEPRWGSGTLHTLLMFIESYLKHLEKCKKCFFLNNLVLGNFMNFLLNLKACRIRLQNNLI